MTELLKSYPDAEAVGIALLAPMAITTVTATPAVIVPPLIQITRVGGADDGLTDHPHIEVAVFTADRPSSWQLTEAARQIMLASRHTSVLLPDSSQALIDYAVCVAPPQQVAYPDQDLRLVVAIYQLSMRRSAR